MKCKTYRARKLPKIELTTLTRKHAQVVTDLQTSYNKVAAKVHHDVFALLVSSCRDGVILISLEQIVITLLYKIDDGNRLATSCSNKTN